MMATPFVKKVKTGNSYYIYDVNTNHILKVPEVIYAIIDKIGNKSKQDLRARFAERFTPGLIDQALEKIYHLQEDGLFLPNRPAKVKLHFNNREKPLSLSSVVLEVTENCNLGCRYCIYRSIDYPTHKSGPKRTMNLETGEKAIDFFFKNHSPGSEMLLVGFYGGEPFLDFGLIEKLVSYAKKLPFTKPVTFSVTSNGTLLTPGILDRLVEEKFLLTLSLDGPEEVHDKMRYHPGDKSGSFKSVMQVLDYLKTNYPEYYQQNLNFSAVMYPPFDFEQLNDFFSRFPIKVFASLAEYTYKESKSTKKRKTAKGWEKIKQCFLDKAKNKEWGKDYLQKKGNFIVPMFFPGLKKILSRDLDLKPFNSQHIYKTSFGFCYPGEERLYINTQGDIYLCEKVDGNDLAVLGNVKTGVEPERLSKLLNIFESHEFNSCKSCWLIRFCSICFAKLLYNNKIDSKKLTFSCKNNREILSDMLQIFCEVMEGDEKALEFLGTYKENLKK